MFTQQEKFMLLQGLKSYNESLYSEGKKLNVQKLIKKIGRLPVISKRSVEHES